MLQDFTLYFGALAIVVQPCGPGRLRCVTEYHMSQCDRQPCLPSPSLAGRASFWAKRPASQTREGEAARIWHIIGKFRALAICSHFPTFRARRSFTFFLFVFPFCRLRAALKNYFLHLTEKPDILSSSTHMNDRLSFPLCCLRLCLSRSDILCCAS